jgi:hypothetical protein
VHVVPTCDRGHTLYPVRAVWAAQNASQHRDVQSLLVVHARPVARFARRVYGAARKDGPACQGTVHMMHGGCSIVQDRFHKKPSWQKSDVNLYSVCNQVVSFCIACAYLDRCSGSTG